MTQTAANDVRVTYPLNDDDIRELEELESKLKEKAEAAEQKQRVALHRVYNEIMKGSTITIAHAKLRSAREANADRSRRHKTLKKTVKDQVLVSNANGNSPGAAGATPAGSGSRPTA